jgi:hypothetical protein
MALAVQQFPEPAGLAELVRQVRYRPGWRFRLEDIDRGQGSKGLTLIITTCGYDAYHPEQGENYRVNHYMPVPPAAYDNRSWRRWLFEQCLLVERHECMEFFALTETGDFMTADGEHVTEKTTRPYAPNHGPGNDPYIVAELTTREARRTAFTGVLNPEIEPCG